MIGSAAALVPERSFLIGVGEMYLGEIKRETFTRAFGCVVSTIFGTAER